MQAERRQGEVFGCIPHGRGAYRDLNHGIHRIRGSWMMDMGNQIVVYKASDGNELAIKTDGETVWMTIEQMVKLLGRDRTVLIRHINNAIKEGELRRDINVQNLHNIQTGRGRPELMYDLDTLISVGYRVKSPEGVRFRRWATTVLREMLLNRLDEVREIAKLKRRVDIVEGDIKQIKGGVSYLVKQLSEPSDPPRRRIGFDIAAEPPSKPYGKLYS